MLRIYIPVALLIVFIAWIAYRAFVKKDLKQNLSSLYAGFTFVGVWAIIYFSMLK